MYSLKLSTGYFESPIGEIEIIANDNSILSLKFLDSNKLFRPSLVQPNPLIFQTIYQLSQYFSGQLENFNLPLSQTGTPFQQKVWQELQTIPYGTILSYQELAKKISSPKSARAIGNVNSRNQILLLIPCHRVIGADLSLTGYAGGIERKKWLLNHEAKNSLSGK